MKISVLTLFPDMFCALNAGVVGRAMEAGIIDFSAHNIRDFSTDKHRRADDYPFGGGAGMVMTAQPIFDCMEHVAAGHGEGCRRIYMSPKGKKLNDKMARELAGQDLIILCGHYEGVDQRVIDCLIDEEISIGDYVLTGGELAAMVLIDSVSRLVPGVLGSNESSCDESFADNMLEYPHYTRPADFRGMKVPEVLLGGNHALIEKWREEQSLKLTEMRRPDLLKWDKQEK
ncbi:MAG: tRNA (guanosine(37)-N1)-methyltransferase TrmD [Christensenellales bacterium]|jgi:tRNA (guanine37-N1)-methyltransferase